MPPRKKPTLNVEPINVDEIASLQAQTRMPTRDDIARRAYELYLTRGGADGQDQEDWLSAERELATRVR